MKTLPTELNTGDKGLSSNQDVICNELSQFFANIDKNLSELIPSINEHLTNNK